MNANKLDLLARPTHTVAEILLELIG